MNWKNIYFIGIGGIGMSALARYYLHAGCRVSGYDRTPGKITRALEKEGASVHYTEDTDCIPRDREHTLVIYTPAVPEDMKELAYVKENGYTLIKRSRALGEIAMHQTCLAVAGTHGKTTVSTLLAHIYTASCVGCSAFLGGISKNYRSNLLLSKNPVLVAEADEFDRSFLQLYPDAAVITSMDADHLDIYHDHQTLRSAFSQFASQIKPSGNLIMKKGLPLDTGRVKAKIYTYSFREEADFYAGGIELQEGGYFKFDLHYPDGILENCTVGIPGWVNVENAVAASAVAILQGIDKEKIREALATFAGVERRFDIHINTPQIAYIDDYAHHPREIASAISSIRNIFPDRKLCGIFQPHLYTRTRDFAEDFAESLGKLDELILLDIYPARELPIPGVSSRLIFDRVDLKEKVLIPKEELLDYLKNKETDILVTLGAGDIDRLVGPIEELLETRISTRINKK